MNLQDTIHKARDGAGVVLGDEVYDLNGATLEIDHAITLRGTAPARNRLQSGTRIVNGEVRVTSPYGNVTLEHFILNGGGIVLDPPTPHKMAVVRLNGLSVWRAPVNGLSATGAVDHLRLFDCFFTRNAQWGVVIPDGTCWPRVIECYFSANNYGGLWLMRTTAARARDCYFEGNVGGHDLFVTGGWNHILDGLIFEGGGDSECIGLNDTDGAVVSGCHSSKKGRGLLHDAGRNTTVLAPCVRWPGRVE